MKKIFIKNHYKNTKIHLKYSELYSIMLNNKLKMCLKYIKTDSAIEKRERQKEYIERCVISVAFFTQAVRKKVIGADRLVKVYNIVQNK